LRVVDHRLCRTTGRHGRDAPSVASDSALIDGPGLKARNIGVETATTYFVAVLTELGVALPETDGALAFKALPALMA